MCSNACESSASPAKMAISLAVHHVVRRLPAAEVVVVHAREVVVDEDMVWIISSAQAVGMAISIVPPMSSHAAMVRHGRMRLPPARRE